MKNKNPIGIRGSNEVERVHKLLHPKLAEIECAMKGRMSQCSGKSGEVCFHNDKESEECSNNVHNNGDGTEPCPQCNNYGDYDPISKEEVFDATGFNNKSDEI